MNMRKLNFSSYLETSQKTMLYYERIITWLQFRDSLTRTEAITHIFLMGLKELEQLYGIAEDENE